LLGLSILLSATGLAQGPRCEAFVLQFDGGMTGRQQILTALVVLIVTAAVVYVVDVFRTPPD